MASYLNGYTFLLNSKDALENNYPFNNEAKFSFKELLL